MFVINSPPVLIYYTVKKTTEMVL